MTRRGVYGALWFKYIIGINSMLCGKEYRPYVEQILGVAFPGESDYEKAIECRRALARLADGLKRGDVRSVETYINLLQNILPIVEKTRPNEAVKIRETIEALQTLTTRYAQEAVQTV